eukprot:CAMPEP_0198531106 /NCGR_PEP_ID=MMETSP1462-20131121/26745_1 /TAXON_ID=1333877 /ORGANISM="Brandtodinium nutriculum, Strain RCC3387" /LENGTH=36 /DNA_ID= /DNA_START= /DNA_END= /DNA_ORIENTATION=
MAHVPNPALRNVVAAFAGAACVGTALRGHGQEGGEG